MTHFKPGNRIVITGERPAKKLQGLRGYVLYVKDSYVIIMLDQDPSFAGSERGFPDTELTLEKEWDSPLMKALR